MPSQKENPKAAFPSDLPVSRVWAFKPRVLLRINCLLSIHSYLSSIQEIMSQSEENKVSINTVDLMTLKLSLGLNGTTKSDVNPENLVVGLPVTPSCLRTTFNLFFLEYYFVGATSVLICKVTFPSFHAARRPCDTVLSNNR